MQAQCGDCGGDAVDLLQARADYLVDSGRAERAIASEVQQAYRRCGNTHHRAAGWSNGQPLIQPLGGQPYPATGQMITNASVLRGSSLQFLSCGTRLGQMTRRQSVEVASRAAIAELAYLEVFQDRGGSGSVDIQRCYVGGFCPRTLAFEIDTTEPLTVGYFRRISFQSALALEPRGAILEIRKGRLFPFALDPAVEVAPPDYDDQVYQNPDSDYYRFPSRRAFLISFDGTVEEIEPGSNEHIGAWDYDRRGFVAANYLNNGATDYCEGLALPPGGYFVSNDSNRYQGNITVLQTTEPAIGSTVPVANLTSQVVRDRLLFGSDEQMEVWLCNVQPQTSTTECRAVVLSARPVILPRIRPSLGSISVPTNLLQLSGLLTP